MIVKSLKEVDEMKHSYRNKNTNFLVVDIETPREGNHRIIDIAVAVWSKKNGIQEHKGFLVKEYESLQTFYKTENFYKNYQKENIYKTRSFKQVMNIIQGIIEDYDIQYVTAYNSEFDVSRIESLCKNLNISNPLENLIEFDMYHTACQTIGKQAGYKKFIDRNRIFGEITKKGTFNRKAGAEAMFKYITLNPNFIEEHTGFGDILIEVQILDLILRQKKRMNIGRNNSSWKLVQG